MFSQIYQTSWPSVSRIAAALLVIGVLAACNRSEEQGSAPPAPVTTQEKPCAGVSSAPQEGLPGKAGGFCIDKDSDIRRYGVSTGAGLDAVCVELFNGECELYKSYGLEGVKILHYVSSSESTESVNVVVSSFRRSAGAFGFFTKRILGDALPSQLTVAPLEAVQGRAVIGTGMVYLWRGKQVVELTFLSDEATPEEVKERSAAVLPQLASGVSELMIGKVEPEASVLLLESLGADVLGVEVAADELLGITGTGTGALGYFSKSETPHRILAVAQRDETGAKDLLRLFRRAGVSKKLKGQEIYRLRRTQEGRAPETWFLRRKGDWVLGVGPLVAEQRAELSTPEERKAKTQRFESFAVRRLRGLELPAPTPSKSE